MIWSLCSFWFDIQFAEKERAGCFTLGIFSSFNAYAFFSFLISLPRALVSIAKVPHNSRIDSERKSSILLARTGVRKISSVACGFSSIKIDYYYYQKSLISRLNEVHAFFQ